MEEGTDAVINLLASNPTNILDHRSYFGGSTEQDEHLVEGMRSEIVYEPVGFEREVLPCSVEVQAESVKALVVVSFRQKAGLTMHSPRLKLVQDSEGPRVARREFQQLAQREEV